MRSSVLGHFLAFRFQYCRHHSPSSHITTATTVVQTHIVGLTTFVPSTGTAEAIGSANHSLSHTRVATDCETKRSINKRGLRNTYVYR